MAGRKRGERGLTRLERWPQYFAGMLTETAYILGLTLVAFLIAVLAIALYR
jgi:hypothetical protein